MKKSLKVLVALCMAVLGIVLLSPDGVYAATGPNKSKESFAYICTGSKLVGQTEWGTDRYSNNYIYMSDNMKSQYENDEYTEFTTDIPKGLSYNEKTNTLTLNNYVGTEISCNEMGDDFKIELKGESTVEMIYIWAYDYGGSLTITGNGVLNVKGGSFFEEDQLYGRCGIKIFGENLGAKAFFKVTKGATVNVEGDGSYEWGLISVFQTKETKNGIVLDGVNLSGGILRKYENERPSSVTIKVKQGDFEYYSYYYLIKKGKKQFLYREIYSYVNDALDAYYVAVYTNTDEPEEIERYDTIDDMIAAGYERVMEPEYGYDISGKSCTISAKSSETKKDDILVSGNLIYAVQSVGTKKKAGSVYAVGFYKYGDNKELTIPKTIKVDGITYKVTGICDGAFAYYNIEKVVIGANVKTIGKEAFYHCKDIKEIVISSTKLKSSTVKKNAFTGTSSDITIKVPAKKLSSYKKILTGKGVNKKAKFTK